MHLGAANRPDQVGDVFWSDAGAWEDFSTATSRPRQAGDLIKPFQRRVATSRRQHSRCSEIVELPQRFLLLWYYVKRSVENDVAASRYPNELGPESTIQGAVGKQSSGSKTIGAKAEKHFRISQHQPRFGPRVAEAACPGAYHGDHR